MAILADSKATAVVWHQPSLLWLGFGLMAIVSVFTLTPVLFIITNSFNSAPPNENYRFGFEGWRDAFGSPRTLNAIGYTFLLNIRSFVGIAIAFVFSWLLTRVRIPLRNFIEFSLWIAYFLPSLPLALSWILRTDQSSDSAFRVQIQCLFAVRDFLDPFNCNHNSYHDHSISTGAAPDRCLAGRSSAHVRRRFVANVSARAYPAACSRPVHRTISGFDPRSRGVSD